MYGWLHVLEKSWNVLSVTYFDFAKFVLGRMDIYVPALWAAISMSINIIEFYLKIVPHEQFLCEFVIIFFSHKSFFFKEK